jgi:hypothetical protein
MNKEQIYKVFDLFLLYGRQWDTKNTHWHIFHIFTSKELKISTTWSFTNEDIDHVVISRQKFVFKMAIYHLIIPL